MRIPKYRRRPDRDYAFVEYRGDRITLPGKYDSPESKAAYGRFVHKILRDQQPSPEPLDWDVTVATVAAAYLDHAYTYYLADDGKPGGEYGHLRLACKVLVRVHGQTAAAAFGPKDLKAVREAMVEGSWIRDGEAYRPWSRPHVNRQIGRLRRVFRWAAEQEMLPASVSLALGAVAPLKKGRTEAAEPEPIRPVPIEIVYATQMVSSPVLAVMIEVQRLTGMRPDNLCNMRAKEIDRTGDVWIYRPVRHKKAWRGQELLIPLGPRCQRILDGLLERPEDAYLFSPRESEAWRLAQIRKRPASKRTSRAKRPRRPRYDPRSYFHAIGYAIKRAGVPHWHPNQLRHSVGSSVRQRYGLEGSQVYLGHAHADVTQIYAERDLELALRIAREIG